MSKQRPEDEILELEARQATTTAYIDRYIAKAQGMMADLIEGKFEGDKDHAHTWARLVSYGEDIKMNLLDRERTQGEIDELRRQIDGRFSEKGERSWSW